MDAQHRIEESMQRLGRTLEKARQDPRAVIDGAFRGTSPSGAVTVWVDSLGRLERVRIEPGTCGDCNETHLADELRAANAAARRAAEELDFEQTGDRVETRSDEVNEDEFFEEPDSFLQ